jgi:Flp pilus assembly protein TadG
MSRLGISATRPRGRRTRSFFGNQRGAAAIELALWAGILVIPILSVVDIGFYQYQKAELETATDAAGQALFNACDPVKLPVTLRCTGYSTVINNAMSAATSLGGSVTATATTEGYYCMNGTALQATGGALANGPTTCSNGAASADYVQITGSYSYSPVFTGITVASLLTTPITKTIWVRMN